MPITRQDAWTQDEDLILAETVLRHIREGGTQLKAFEEVGKRLSRTGAACGFRWNSYVRKQYASGIELAKKQRKELKKQAKKVEVEQETDLPTEGSLDQNATQILDITAVKGFLDGLYEKVEQVHSQEELVIEYEERIKELEGQVAHLSSKNEKLVSELNAIENDHRALLGIMERARKIVGDKEKQSV
jgi:prespore-specific regulator